jgi:hypothetical protein
MSIKALEISRLQPRDTPYKVADENGLYLQIQPSGAKLWRLKFRFRGLEKKLALGQFPEVSLTGKSTILREIAMSFRQYFASESLRSRQGLARLSQIHIICDQQPATLNLKLEAKAFRAEREAVRTAKLAPSKLIALSFTPFDKFPPADDTRHLGRPDAVVPFYVYLGFKSDFRLSPRARLLRSIDQLAFAASVPNHIRNMGAIARIGRAARPVTTFFASRWRTGIWIANSPAVNAAAIPTPKPITVAAALAATSRAVVPDCIDLRSAAKISLGLEKKNALSAVEKASQAVAVMMSTSAVAAIELKASRRVMPRPRRSA